LYSCTNYTGDQHNSAHAAISKQQPLHMPSRHFRGGLWQPIAWLIVTNVNSTGKIQKAQYHLWNETAKSAKYTKTQSTPLLSPLMTTSKEMRWAYSTALEWIQRWHKDHSFSLVIRKNLIVSPLTARFNSLRQFRHFVGDPNSQSLDQQ